MKLLILIGLFLIFNTVHCDPRLIYKCEMTGTKCIFSGINLNLTHYDWDPVADNPSIIEEVQVRSSVIPVVTSNICQKFPHIKKLELQEINVEKVLEDAFMGCKQLEELYLFSNKIKTLEKRTFYNNTAVTMLRIDANLITHLDNSIFEKMINLTTLYSANNNLTEFPSELIRNNKKLKQLYIWSNFILDVEVEKMKDFCPDLHLIYLNDNQILCSRMVDIMNFMKQKGIEGPGIYYGKVRYYPIQNVFGDIRCLPDPSWMAADYRVENPKAYKKLETIEKQIKTIEEKNDAKWKVTEEKFKTIEAKWQTMERKLQKLEEQQSILTQQNNNIEKIVKSIDKKLE